MTGLLLASLVTLAAAAGDDRPALTAALQTAQWIRSTGVDTEHGRTWPMDPDDTRSIVRHLYSGTPGVILFLLELDRAAPGGPWRAEAMRGADELVAWLDQDPAGNGPGFWTGLAGQSFVLHRAHVATGVERYRVAAVRAAERLRDTAARDGTGVRWNDSTDVVSGSAGIGFFLLYAADAMDLPWALPLATETGTALIAVADTIELADGRQGLDWHMTPDFPRRMPNYSHGTAGVASFLAALHEVNGDDPRFRDAARAGGRFLVATAASDDAAGLVRHHDPGGLGLFYLGWCHGPVGTTRLFARLDRIDPGGGWEPWLDRGADALMTSGIPEHRTPGFWANVGQCCGSAGVAAFFLERSTGDDAARAFALRMHEDVMQRSTRVDLPGATPAETVGLKWIQAEHRVRPDFLVAQTGYMQGAAGVGLWLLRLDADLAGRSFGLRFPDDGPAAD
jgi:hypothetical protein